MLFRQRQPIRQVQEGALFGIIFFTFVVLYSFFTPNGQLRDSAVLVPEAKNVEPLPISPPQSQHGKSHEHPSESSATTSNDPLPEAPPQPYSRVLVIARAKKEDVSWIDRELVDMPDLEKAVYTVDDPHSRYHVPENKGHEVMVYLTHMIDNYDNLSDITLFMHSHLITWHNNDLLDSSAASMIKRLSTPRVIREGYMNMRCHWDPGCPDHLHPFSGTASNNIQQPEEVIFANSWLELFPNTTVPAVLSQPCCGQFALSKSKIRSIPRDQYIQYRDWILSSKLPDNLSGRVWEYLWQVIFAGVAEFCPKEHICYCDGYGICFGGEKEYNHWFNLRTDKRRLEAEREHARKQSDEGKEAEIHKLDDRIQHVHHTMEKLKQEALKNGMDAEFRAREVGRKWALGDGF